MKKKYRVTSMDYVTREHIVDTEISDTFVPAEGHTTDEYLQEQALEKAREQEKQTFKDMGVIAHKNVDKSAIPVDGEA